MIRRLRDKVTKKKGDSELEGLFTALEMQESIARNVLQRKPDDANA